MTPNDREPVATPQASGEMSRNEIQALFERRQEAIDNLDAAALSRDYAEDCVVESPAGGGALTGRAEVERVRRIWFESFPDLKFTMENLLIDGNHVVQIMTMEGTDIGGFMGLAPKGRSFKVPAVYFYELRDGLIARERRIYDFTGMLVQVGAIKAKPV
jgi:steroid delta-isomerase-like uncharacterized protein